MADTGILADTGIMTMAITAAARSPTTARPTAGIMEEAATTAAASTAGVPAETAAAVETVAVGAGIDSLILRPRVS